MAYDPFIGGAEVAIKEIARRLPDFNFEMITANLDGKQQPEEQIGNIKVYRTSLFPPPYQGGGWGEVKKAVNKYLFPWLAYKKAIELHQKNNYQMIWSMMANQAGWAALKFKKKFPTVNYLLSLQEGDSERDIWFRTWFMRPTYKAIYRRADRIQAISSFLAQRAKNFGAKCPIEVVPNGVKVQSEKRKAQNKNLIITVSRLVKKNGISDLIKSIQLLISNYKLAVELIILGDGILRGELEKLVKDLKLEQSVKFLGNIPNEKVYDYLAAADIFVRPSLSEGLGNSFLEAMAAAVPTVGTPVGGIPDFLKDGETGWFCQVNNPPSIADKIKYILDEKNKTEVDRVVVNAKKMVESEYNWDNVAAKILFSN